MVEKANFPSRIDKNTLWKEHQMRFTCEHPDSALRVRTIKGGGKQHVRQCLRCGDAVSNPIKAEVALAQNNGNPLPPFDEQLQASWKATAKESANRIMEVDDSAFWQAYEKYLASPEWQKKRAKVLSRALGLCEGCGESPAVEIHHLSYEHVGDELNRPGNSGGSLL